MERRLYLKSRFEGDFLKYSLLQEDSLAANEIADKLLSAVNLNEFICQARQEIESLCEEHLPFNKVKVYGELSNELTPALRYDLKDRIIEGFESHLNKTPIEEICHTLMAEVEKRAELVAWCNGIANMQEAIALFGERLGGSAASFARLHSTTISEEELLEKFNKANEITLLERVRGNNIDDIIDYRSSLLEYARERCDNLLHDRLSAIYTALAEGEGLKGLQAKFGHLLEYAEELNASIVELERNEAWEEAYNRLVPTDFYYRNVESITPEHAFHMVLLQFFARNESWMVENGLLENGVLKVYVGSNPNGISTLLSHIVESL